MPKIASILVNWRIFEPTHRCTSRIKAPLAKISRHNESEDLILVVPTDTAILSGRVRSEDGSFCK